MHKAPPAPDARPRSSRPGVTVALLVVLLATLAPLGKQGVTSALHTWREHQRITARVSALRAENTHLRRVTERLRGDLAVIEAAAREQLGLGRPRETGFVLRGSSPDSTPSLGRPAVDRARARCYDFRYGCCDCSTALARGGAAW